ncbi:MAG TPA: zinc metallopeptidase [bacterium]|nr:zinc metallopeptidase [bacterium]
MIGFGFSYLWLIFPAIILGLVAQFTVRSTYRKYSKYKTRGGTTGAGLARTILDTYGLNRIPVKRVAGSLTDHYDPRRQVLRLSEGVYSSHSVAAIGIAAHEAGHAIQHSKSYFPLAVRNAVYPVASFGSNLGPILVIGGLFFGAFQFLISIGIILFAAAVFFSIITLPVEFNASNRAMSILKMSGVLTQTELKGARSVLSAASLTYLASALASVLSLLRLILLSRSR